MTFSLVRGLMASAFLGIAGCEGPAAVSPVVGVARQGALVAGDAAAVNSEGYSIRVGESVTLELPAGLRRSRNIEWMSSSNTIAAVNASGTVRAFAVGTAVIMATSGGAVEQRFTVQVEPELPQPEVTVLSLSPVTSAMLAPGETRQYSVSAYWSDGVIRPVAVTYSASGGSITSDGLFTAGQLAGTFAVVAHCACGVIASRSVEIGFGAAQLQKLTIHPKAVTLASGATQQFTVTANWSTGATDLPPVTWRASGGSVNSEGLFRAPESATGPIIVYVQHRGSQVRDSAVVTSATGPEGSPLNPVSGVKVLYQDDFESGDSKTTQNGIRWTEMAWVSVTSAISRGGGKSLRFGFDEHPQRSEARFGGLAELPEVYLQYWLYQPNGRENPSVGVDVPTPGKLNDKFFRLWGRTYGTDNNVMYGASTWNGEIGVEYRRVRPDGNLESMGQAGAAILPDVRTWVPFFGNPEYKGRWVRVGIRCKVASPNTSNGILQVWLDDKLVLDRQHLDSHAGPGGLNAFTDGYLLGAASNGFARGARLYIDDFTISIGGFPPQ